MREKQIYDEVDFGANYLQSIFWTKNFGDKIWISIKIVIFLSEKVYFIC